MEPENNIASETEIEKEKTKTVPPLRPQPIPKLKLQTSRIRRGVHKHTSTSTSSSSINLCIQKTNLLEEVVSAYIRPTEINIDMLLTNARKLDSYRFDGLEVEELRDKFKTAINIRETDYQLFTGNVYMYHYPLITQEDIYETTKELHKKHLSKG